MARYHRRYFTRQAGFEGFEFDEDILTAFERFEIAWPLDVADMIARERSQRH